jgi:hypothetical protein
MNQTSEYSSKKGTHLPIYLFNSHRQGKNFHLSLSDGRLREASDL